MPENWNYPNNCCRKSYLHIFHKICEVVYNACEKGDLKHYIN